MKIIGRIIGGIFGIIVLFFLVLGVMAFQGSYQYDTLTQKAAYARARLGENLNILNYNIMIEFKPPRKLPVSLMKQEDGLKTLAPNVFKEFSRRDWKEFWDIIYRPRYVNVGRGYLRQKMYRTKAEIEEYFRKEYENPFAYFRKNHWGYFWNIIKEGDRQFKHVNYQPPKNK